MGQGKEAWLHGYECAVEELMDVEGRSREEATRDLDEILERHPDYLELFSLVSILNRT